MTPFGEVPYFLCGDINVELSKSEVIRATIAQGNIVDVRLAHAENPDCPQKTFCQAAVLDPSMSGKGTPRIDGVLANPTGAAAVKEVKYRWDFNAH